MYPLVEDFAATWPAQGSQANLQVNDDGHFFVRDNPPPAEFSSPSKTLVTTFAMMLGDFSPLNFWNGPRADVVEVDIMETVRVAVFVAFLLFVQVILLNLLVGVMSDSIAHVKRHQTAVACKERAALIVDFEEQRMDLGC